MSKLFTPLLLVNFKTYLTAVGKEALSLAEEIKEAKEECGSKACVAISVQPTDIRLVADVGLPVLAQHIDAVNYGSFTGHILPEAVKEAGAIGTLLNHSERQIPNEKTAAGVKRAKEVGLETVVCAKTPEMSAIVASYYPDFIAIEPPELIGGDISVSKANPEIITDTIKLVEEVNSEVPVLCGAGVKDGDDVKIASKLGSKGILVASGVTKAVQPKTAIKDLLKGFL